MISLRLLVVAVFTVFFGIGASGCVAVKPYQREYLSHPVMTPGSERPEDRFRQHWQFAREGSEGGFGGAGGGCGCN
jgi:hypothetical protein